MIKALIGAGMLLLWAAPAPAAVYKCTDGGQIRYSDQPCHPGDAPADLPPANTIAAQKPSAQGKRYDAELAASKKARQQADRAFLKSHDQQQAHADAVHKAIIAHRAIKGMTASDVESALGAPDQKDAKGHWLYREEDRQVTVEFGEQGVSKVSSRKAVVAHPRKRRR